MWNLRKVITLSALGTLILGTILIAGLVGCKNGDENMGIDNDGLVSKEGIPLIDISAPIITETATFALG